MHYVDLNSIKEKIYVIKSIAYSGERFAIEYQLRTGNDFLLYSQKDYWLQTKALVSNLILDLAIKIRNACESIEHKDHVRIVTCIENEKVTSHDFIWVCNKIVHAKSFNLVAVGAHQYDESLEWWDGDIDITGEFRGKLWKVSFDAIEWLKSCCYHIQSIENILIKGRNNSQDLARCCP